MQNRHTKQYHAATPIVRALFGSFYWTLSYRQPGTIVVNVADLLARWSNDVLVSTLHRVVTPPTSLIPGGWFLQDLHLGLCIDQCIGVRITPARQSIAFFCNPNGGATIDCLPSCLGSGGKSKYLPVTTEAYIVSRCVVYLLLRL